MLINQGILLASPIDVLTRLFTLIGEKDFWGRVAFSFVRISVGFVVGLVVAVVLAVTAARYEWIEIMLSPLMVTIKTVPVASFIIIALIWISSEKLSAFISFIMVLPVIYNNVLEGIKSIDHGMNEMADVYHLKWGTRLKYICVPSVFPFLLSGCRTGLGFAWKAGVAAEIIGIPEGSIGEQMYMSKVYLDSASLLAWTVVIVVISVLFEKLVLYIIRKIYGRIIGEQTTITYDI